MSESRADTRDGSGDVGEELAQREQDQLIEEIVAASSNPAKERAKINAMPPDDRDQMLEMYAQQKTDEATANRRKAKRNRA